MHACRLVVVCVPMNTHRTTTRVIDYFVAVRNLARSQSVWRANAVHTLLDAVQQLPADADAAPLIDIAHRMDGIMWTVMEQAGAPVPTEPGETLAPDAAIAALRTIAAQVIADDMDFRPEYVTDDELAAIEALDETVLECSIITLGEAAERYKVGNADLAEQLHAHLHRGSATF